MAIDGLRARGAAHFDPVRFRFIESLARRAAAHGGAARRELDRRLAKLVADYADRFDRATDAAGDTLARATTRFPQAAEALKQCSDEGDFGGLQQLIARLDAQSGNGPLADLLAHIARYTPDGPTSGAAHAAGGSVEQHGELRSMRNFRSTWSKLSVDRQLSQALAQAPENAGPLNSHFLVLQALTQMRDISPQYLKQFMSYVDTLLWLDQAESGRSPTQKNVARGEREKKRKSGRGTAG
ncbi:MAG: DUF2894 domain-containing protein [Azoarcus sp.]|nr:DUF2894 domain-containing protein [Azoarcus sp.]